MVDSSGNGRDGSYSTTTGLGATGLAGDSDTAYDCDIGGWGEVPAAAWMDTTQVTVECLVRFSTVVAGDALVARFGDGGQQNQSWILWVNGSGKLAVRFYTGTASLASGSVDIEWTSAPAVGVIYHVAATYDGTTARLYVDGTQVASSTALSGPLKPSAGALSAGAYATNTPSTAATLNVEAVIDEVALFGTALSAARIAAHYAAVGVGAAPSADLALAATLRRRTASFSMDAVEPLTDVFDDFERANSATSLGVTSSGAVPWEALQGTWGILNGAAAVYGGTASTVCFAAVETGQADCIVETVIATAQNDSNAGLLLRSSGAGNGYVVEGGAASTGATAKLYRGVGGAYTVLAETAGPVSFAAGDVVQATLDGPDITVRRNGVVILAATDSTHLTETKHGLYTLAPSGAPGVATFGSFSVTGDAPPADLTLQAMLRRRTASFALVSEADLSLAATLRRRTAAFAMTLPDLPAQVSLDATLRRRSASFSLLSSAPLTVDTTNRINGRNRTGLALVRFEPTVVLPPSPEPEHERHVGAVAFSTPTIVGAQPVYTVSEATKKRTRHRILVGGKDVSFYRDIATPEPGYGLAEPLLWDRCTIEFPQVAAAFESPGKGQLRWCRKGAPVVLQRVTAAGEIVSIDYRGVVIGHDISGKTLKVEVGGHASGRAALRYKPLPIFKDTLDLGRLAWAAIRDMGLRFEPRMGPTTGMKQALWGGMWHGEYIDELSARAWQRDGTQWTIMPSDAGVYRMQPKDRTTIDFTVFTDDKRAVPNLRSDASEEPNRIFASGVTPRGQRVRFGVYPGLKPSKPAPYPFLDNRAFGFGTTDADTDTGDGITVMLRTLWGMGYLSLEDADPDGGFDADARDAVEALQDDAGIHDGPLGYLDKGAMDPETWRALFDFDVTGFNIRGARVEPAAQAPRTRRYNRSASGRIRGKNPRFDRHALIVDRPLEFGFGHTRHQMREWSSAEIARGEDNWVGTLDITTGGVLHGEVAPGTVLGGDDIMDVRAIQPGMNAWLPTFAGGILVHVSAVEISYDGYGIPQAKLYVDTQARDAMQVWDVIRRNRESREDPARRRKGNRASTELKDSITEWDEVGGVVYDDVDLQPGWNVIPVVAGQEGSVSRIRVLIQDVTGEGGEVAIQGREFAVAVFGKKVTPARLRHLIGNPLAASPDSTAEPVEDDVDPPEADPEADGADPAPAASANRPWWERKKIADALRNLELLHSAGTKEEPCGYSPGKKSNGGTKTGLYRRDASFSYRTHGEPVLYLAVWVWGERTLSSGRVMWNQLEPGA